MTTLKDLSDELKKFSAERDWDQFHSPKNLTMAIAAEAAELMEPFMWLRQDEELSAKTVAAVKDEVGDVLICLLNFCNKMNINPLEAAKSKLEKNRAKYPVETSFGSAKKYNVD